MKSGLRDYSGRLCLGVGCITFLGSNLVGYGWHIPPDPKCGLLIAAVGVALCGLSLRQVQLGQETYILIRIALMIGSGSLLVSLGSEVIRSFYDVFNSRWGAIPPPALIFGSAYGLASIAGLAAVEIWSRKGCGQP